jgi:hypothetical protein
MRSTLRVEPVAALVLVAVALAIASCGDDNGDGDSGSAGSTLPTGSEPANLDPADFTTEIDNPYWPLAVGSTWVYEEQDPEGALKVVVTVTDQTKQIANGVEARVVHDVVSRGGEPIEVTDDWYAQDSEGNVWYLGEDTAEYEDGKVVSREGSFEAGVDGAEAGVIMPADPQPGLEYRQEYLAGQAEDHARVIGFALQVEVPFGRFDRVLQTEDVNPLGDPQQVENKFFAKDVGPLLTLDLTGSGREELVSYTPGG